jgi:hypothetical protein
MSDETKPEECERSLACRIKDEVDELVASGKFKVVHGFGYRNNTKVAQERENCLQCGCAIGVVSAVADGKEQTQTRNGAVEAIQERWPEITDGDAVQLEIAFEGWEREPSYASRYDLNSEFYKLGKHIRGLAK